jgi:hypothetical protein
MRSIWQLRPSSLEPRPGPFAASLRCLVGASRGCYEGFVRMMPAAVAGVVLAAAAACGGNGNGNGDGTAAGRAIEPEAQQKAESINLTLADFPNGWRVSAPESDDDTGREVFNECIAVDYSGLTRIGDAESQDFFSHRRAVEGGATQASSAVVIFDDEQQAEDAMSKYSESFGGSAAEDCFQDVIERAMRAEGDNEGFEGFKLGEVDIGEVSFTPPDVDEAQAWQIVIPLEATSGVGEGLEPNFYLELVLLREGDATARLLTQDVLQEFDHELRDQLVRAVAGRMTESAT